MTKDEQEPFEKAKERFPELDEHARQRAEAEVRSGADAHAALARESVLQHMNRAYQAK